MKKGVVLIAHGSRRDEANEEMRLLSAQIEQADTDRVYEIAFLEFCSPDLAEAVSRLAVQGVKNVIVMPLFLTTGNHVTQDIPAELQSIKEQFSHMQFVLARHFAAHPALVQIVQERIAEVTFPGLSEEG